ncbi:MAG: hypothetical protein LBB79_09075 [Prevotellaceae bacterium]|jgi:hypothetical protein|nr:hypothetical protein [Prevotellaceae bacterium]
MKRIYLLTLIAAALCAFAGCRRELPYPIDEVQRGVLIDVVRVPGTGGVIVQGQTAGDYKVKLSIPAYQGDYSSLDRAQLLAVLADTQGDASSRVVEDGITAFPVEKSISIADIYAKFGLSAPARGEALYITANVILKNGKTIPGWSEHTGFNNQAFDGWKVDGRAYSGSVKYPVTCPLSIDAFAGAKTIKDEWWEETYQITVAKKSDTELEVSGLFEGKADHSLTITVDPVTHTVSVARQALVDNTSTLGMPYTNLSLSGSGTIDACDGKITFSATVTVDQGSFGSSTFTIY